jgi:hypothetical protein
MKSLWAGRFPLAVLLEDKQRFARSLELKEGKDLLLLFDTLLSCSDPEATYVFTEVKETTVNFTLRKRIAIFDFSWTLRLAKVACNAVELLCRELIAPLAAALAAQSKRVELLRQRFDLVEKDYMRKMSEMEKALYKSPLAEDQEDWRLLLPKPEGRLLGFLHSDEATRFFQKAHLGEGQRKEKEREKEKEVAVFEDERKNRAIAKVMSSDVFEMAEHQLNRQLEKERIKLKKEKRIDFL